ncbi:leader peptidase (prepilin peptidase) / N-methyltransferase/leader peptidase (prepilin peptidase) / N-methyltransferase [Selenomonas ruminantium]|uniref:Leader peptidase (Prepilin peptidase) / N-methyltransferase/leader peptidase (Prepilin peptidase) / N-methyltransferase n=1 Tax=Selenomonas ruminantium TaxID=971 RepID=A0A1M6WHW1_SELRU|nr:A24 family peptidase [Selenomonas ruminantium]SHK93340.1 leader peptidase (prepilin peptidase) / N-methyltransferase/leader peptidase (prepilin peptidase) / N-methyltransferase [Selenomonas ruminantium]
MGVLKMDNQASHDLHEVPEVFSWSLCRGMQWPWLAGMLISGGLLYGFNRQEILLGLLFAAWLLLLAILDFRYLLIYDRLLAGLLILGGIPLLTGRLSWMDAGLGVVLGGGVLGFLRWLVPKGMGWGDIKLAMLLGWWLGGMGVCVALYVAFMSGGLCSVYLLLRHRLSKESVVPFGPFLALGAIVAFALADRCGEVVRLWLWW